MDGGGGGVRVLPCGDRALLVEVAGPAEAAALRDLLERRPLPAVLTVLAPGPLATVQDAGRPGWAAVGVPPSGAVDGRPAPANAPLTLHPGAVLSLGVPPAGLRSYLGPRLPGARRRPDRRPAGRRPAAPGRHRALQAPPVSTAE